MTSNIDIDEQSIQVAQLWCERMGPSWSICGHLGKGATASVFELNSPQGLRSLKIYNADFSSGKQGEIGLRRIEQQVALRGHDCSSLVQIYEGGTFEGRLYLLMSRAPGKELEKCLKDIPRANIRQIVDQVVRAVMFLESKGHCHRDIKSANIFISDNYEQATLLDISVIRDIYDPIGIGTDHDGQLPVVATTRYTPPEYLFRLLDPGPELWHALNIYQLGALMHDLIMREPLFESEHIKSRENRYRFAWIVATTVPKIHADDVDKDLVFTAQRALDKDWKRRSSLRLEDFLCESAVLEKHALTLIGLTAERDTIGQGDFIADRLQRIRDVASRLENDVLQYLRKYKVTPIHKIAAGTNDTSKVLTFRWDAQLMAGDPSSRTVEFRLQVELLVKTEGYYMAVTPSLSVSLSGTEKTVTIDLPELPDEQGVEAALASQAEAAFTRLAAEIVRVDPNQEP